MRFEKFFDKEENRAVHCEREEDAKLLLAMFDDAGYKWRSDESYTSKLYWSFYCENTCYDNTNGYCDLEYCRLNNIKVFTFREFLAEEFISVLQTLKSLNLRGDINDFTYLSLINDALDAYAEFKEGGEI